MSGQRSRRPGWPHHTDWMSWIMMGWPRLKCCAADHSSGDLLLLPTQVTSQCDPTAVDRALFVILPVDVDQFAEERVRLPTLDLAADGLILKPVGLCFDHGTDELACNLLQQAGIGGKLEFKLIIG